jgi:septum formation protein
MLRVWRVKKRRRGRTGPRDLPVLGADTIVILNGEVLEKPRDAGHAAEMLRMLSGKTHQVMTAVALADKQLTLDCLVVTEVTFRLLRTGYCQLCGQRRTSGQSRCIRYSRVGWLFRQED